MKPASLLYRHREDAVITHLGQGSRVHEAQPQRQLTKFCVPFLTPFVHQCLGCSDRVDTVRQLSRLHGTWQAYDRLRHAVGAYAPVHGTMPQLWH